MFSPAHLLLIFLVLLLPAIASTVIPISEILHRSGHSRWWAPICFVPLVNLCGALGLRIHPLARLGSAVSTVNYGQRVIL